MEEAGKKAGISLSAKITIGVLVGLVIVLGALAAVYSFTGKDNRSASTSQTTTSTKSAATNRVVDEGVTWVTPIKLSDLGLFSNNDQFEGLGGYNTTDYYKVGYMSDGRDVIVAEVDASPLVLFRFFGKEGQYTEIVKNSAQIEQDTAYKTGDFAKDNTFQFNSLLPDKTITKGQTDLIYSFNGGIIERDEGFSDGVKIAETKWGDLYREVGQEIDGSSKVAKTARYYIKMNDSTKAHFDPKPTFMRDDGTFDVNWLNQDKASNAYSFVATGGCGGGLGTFPYLDKKVTLESGDQVTPNAKVYFVSEGGNDLVKFGYNIYKMSSNPTKSQDEFIESLGILVWVDDYDSQIVFINNSFKPDIECGKPVIYLYPEESTNVSVKVGANITKSEPNYGDGWNVLAKPSGKLSINNIIYPYLFWEGKGVGTYPEINQGVVVRSADAVTTIKQQMSYIGFNSTEISDFIEFWGPLMPKTQFTRLTWLQNQQMDQLAPIKISPKPNSVIRAFLDFSGLDYEASISRQNLNQYSRDGFTAVEWGGLLRK